MSELRVHLNQASLNPSIWGRDNENNFAKLYFCPAPKESITTERYRFFKNRAPQHNFYLLINIYSW